jgi:Uma2 family endonuclease
MTREATDLKRQASMATVHLPTAQRLVLYGVDWRTYSGLLRLLEGRPGLRLTYDRGALEIMNVTFGHENDADLLGRFIAVLTEEQGREVAGGGSTTFRRRRLRRGLEPDNCYWIANEAHVRGKRRIDLRKDPPPDVAIEIDIFHSSLDRMAIYAALRVPEVWRFDDRVLTFHAQQADGTYADVVASISFPFLTAADLSRFLALRAQHGENAIVAQFRAWVRQQLGASGSGSP